MSAVHGNPGTNGIHDMGGIAPPFKPLDKTERDLAQWEFEVDALVSLLSAKKKMNVDMLRKGVESLEPDAYSNLSYYGRWGASVAKAMVDQGHLSQNDIEEAFGPSPSSTEAVFKLGDTVHVKPESHKSRWRKPHLRVPGYIHGCTGVIEKVVGVFPNPENKAFNLSSNSTQPLYRVRFQMSEVWPEFKNDSKDTVDVEVYQHWLEAGKGSPMTLSKDGHKHDHDHDHDETVDHGDHTHEPRMQIEQTAIDREGDPQADASRRIGEVIVEACIKKGLVTKEELRTQANKMIAATNSRMGAKIVAKAWTDPAFKKLLLQDANKAVADVFGVSGSSGPAPMVLYAVENTDSVHNLIVCTLCSCYPRQILGIPPDWYKSRSYRARAIRQPRVLLKEEFGLTIPDNVELRVHDSTADLRYLVIPQQPKRTQGWSEEELVKIIHRDSMIGVAKVE